MASRAQRARCKGLLESDLKDEALAGRQGLRGRQIRPLVLRAFPDPPGRKACQESVHRGHKGLKGLSSALHLDHRVPRALKLRAYKYSTRLQRVLDRSWCRAT